MKSLRREIWAGAAALAGLAGTPGPSVAQEALPPVPSTSPPSSPTPSSIEERLRKLEEMNNQLLRQNQELDARLRALSPSAPVDAPEGGAPATGTVPSTTTTGAVSSTEGMLPPPLGGPADRSPGADVNIIENVPSRGSAEGGGDLISFQPDDPGDATGVKMLGRFGRRFTNNGLWFESPDKVFQFHVGGRYQMDATAFSVPNNVQFAKGGIGELRDGVNPRRMRVRLEGAMYENTLFCSEFDFINSTIPIGKTTAGRETSVANTPGSSIPVPLDLWVTFRNIPVIGHIRIGNQKEPFGFERLTSSRFLNFMERSFNNDAFYSPWSNGFEPGISTFSTYADRRGTYALGVFKNITNPWAYDFGGSNLMYTGRLTFLPLYANEGRQLMHVGISGRQSTYDNGFQRFRVRGPERPGISTVWPNYADTGVFNGGGGQQDLNIELVNVFGPWTIDAEYNFHWSQNAFLPHKNEFGTLYYSGGYVEVLYFLTGEHRAYVRESGLFDRVVPKHNAYWVKGKKGAPDECGWGAWQVGVRYNYLNLDDKGLNGGVLNDLTLGLNWFINPNLKFQMNYSLTNRHAADPVSNGVIQGFGTRFAFDF